MGSRAQGLVSLSGESNVDRFYFPLAYRGEVDVVYLGNRGRQREQTF